MEQLQNTKLQLETVNDSMTAQLEEHKKKEEQLEEELEEVQRTAEQDNDAFQSHLADMEVKFMHCDMQSFKCILNAWPSLFPHTYIFLFTLYISANLNNKST